MLAALASIMHYDTTGKISPSLVGLSWVLAIQLHKLKLCACPGSLCHEMQPRTGNVKAY